MSHVARRADGLPPLEVTSNARFLSQQSNGYAVVPAPVGLTVTGLPPGATPLTINGAVYYVAGATYLRPVMQGGVTVYVTAHP